MAAGNVRNICFMTIYAKSKPSLVKLRVCYDTIEIFYSSQTKHFKTLNLGNNTKR